MYYLRVAIGKQIRVPLKAKAYKALGFTPSHQQGSSGSKQVCIIAAGKPPDIGDGTICNRPVWATKLAGKSAKGCRATQADLEELIL